MPRKFFFVCAGLLCLALAYHLGATSATAQTTKSQVAAAYYTNAVRLSAFGDQGGNLVLMTNGDVYFNSAALTPTGGWLKVGNVFTP